VAPKYSTERLTDDVEQLRLSLLWLIERSMEAHVPCDNCGHDITDHVDDEGQLCLFPATRGAPFVLCRCIQYH
jgi:hypothetical protein